MILSVRATGLRIRLSSSTAWSAPPSIPASDIPDLHGLHLWVMDCTFSTLTPSRVGFIRHDTLRAICEQDPGIAATFLRYADRRGDLQGMVTNVGRREAFTRTAHILCELIYRLRTIARIEDHIAHIPITQAALGDALGLSTVHVNRMLQDCAARA